MAKENLRDLLGKLLGEAPSADFGPLVNPETKHLPVILLIDTSGSMDKKVENVRSIDRVYDKLKSFLQKVEKGETEAFIRFRETADICIMTYGGSVKTMVPWTHASQLKASSLKPLPADGGTPMNAAIVAAGDAMLDRLRYYNHEDSEPYCGAVFNLTDGHPTDEDEKPHARAVVEMFENGTSSGIPLTEFHHVGVPGFSREKLLHLAAKPERIIEISANIEDFFRYIVVTFSNLAGDLKSAVAHAEWLAKRKPS
jgi:uncharacterized protein YegL